MFSVAQDEYYTHFQHFRLYFSSHPIHNYSQRCPVSFHICCFGARPTILSSLEDHLNKFCLRPTLLTLRHQWPILEMALTLRIRKIIQDKVKARQKEKEEGGEREERSSKDRLPTISVCITSFENVRSACGTTLCIIL